MATSPNGNGSTTSGSGPSPVPSTSSGSTPTAASGIDRVDTAQLDAVAARMALLGDRFKVLAAHLDTLARYKPTAGGVNDSTWNSFVGNGYGRAAQSTARGVLAIGATMGAFHDGLQNLSRLFTETEDQNTKVASALHRAFTPNPPAAGDRH